MFWFSSGERKTIGINGIPPKGAKVIIETPVTGIVVIVLRFHIRAAARI